MKNHAEEIPCSERTLYHYIDAGFLTARNIDMHRTVRYRKRKHYTNQPKINYRKKEGTFVCGLLGIYREKSRGSSSTDGYR